MNSRFPFLTFACVAWLLASPVSVLRAQESTPPASTAPAAAAGETAVEPPTPAPAPAPVWIDRGTVLVFGDGVTIREDERASEVVAYGGDVVVEGRVDGKVVAWGGDVTIDGSAGNVMAVGGDLTLGPKAKVSGKVALIGGSVHNPHRVPLRSDPMELLRYLPAAPNLLGWLGDFFLHARLLSLSHVWPWYVFGAGTFFFLVLAAAFGRGVNACARSLEERPGATLTTALALLPLLPLFALLLICTGIGLLLLPFLIVVTLFALVFGKAAVLVFLGRSVLRAFGQLDSLERSWLTVLIGAAVLAVLYCVPVLGLLIWALTAWIGFGMVVATVLENRRREKAAAAAIRAASTPVAPFPSLSPIPPQVVAAPAVAPAEPAAVLAGGELGGATPEAPGAATAPVSTPPVLPLPMAPGVVEASLPRADFWVRCGALLIDIVLIGIAGGMSGLLAVLPYPLLFGGYMFGLWLWRGTTIGGIVFNLKVVRLDGRPLDGATVAVRTLVAFLSAAVLLLGFLWCLWDEELQTWHDKVAGTVVVRVPKSAPLV